MPIETSDGRATDDIAVCFERLPADALVVAGGKGASLARIAAAGFPVPPGFVVCACALDRFLGSERGRLVESLVTGLDVHDPASLQRVSTVISEWIFAHPVPEEVEEAIRCAYGELGSGASSDVLVAVRSSGVSEDGETASYAGQQETYLNVSGADAVVGRVRDCWASFFSSRALFYRAAKGALNDTSMAVVVQQMVQADKSGVLFTADPIRKSRECMVIEAVFGLGEGIVSGTITPDHLLIDRKTGSILEEFVAVKPTAVVWNSTTGVTGEIELPEEKATARVLGESELASLRQLGLRLEEYFGRPQDVEWCIREGKVLLLQSRPITVI